MKHILRNGKLDICALATTGGLLWGGAVAAVALTNLIRPRYGRRFLRTIGSVYPGYSGRSKAKDAAVGIVCAFADGAIGGAVFGAVYNQLASTEEREERAAKAA